MSFKNVAYRPERHSDTENEYMLSDTNKRLIDELTRCGIDIIANSDLVKGEPYTNITGRFGNLKFERAWTYWVVTGLVPVFIAEKIYAHPVGKTDVRIAGHCGCVAPVAPWIKWLDIHGNKEILSFKEKREYEKYIEEYDETTRIGKMARDVIKECIFSDTPENFGNAFVENYHIDSELGMYIFAEHIKEFSVYSF